jgi:hypothetical protein
MTENKLETLKDDEVVVRIVVSITGKSGRPLQTEASAVVDKRNAMRELFHCANCAVECLGAVRRSLSAGAGVVRSLDQSMEKLCAEDNGEVTESSETRTT